MRRARLLHLAAAAACAAVVVFPASAGPRQAVFEAEVAIFYYPWYSTPGRDGRWAHWYVARGGVHVFSSPYFPSRGLYSSSDPRVIRAHMREIARIGVDTVVISWWGAGSVEDERFPLLLGHANRAGLRVAVHLEPYAGRTPQRAAADIARFAAAGIRDFYIYDADRDPAQAWAEALELLPSIRVFGHTTFVGRAKASGFDGIYTYDVAVWGGSTFRRLCAQARQAGLLCAPSVGPGYDARLATEHRLVRPRLHGARYDRMWRAALGADADLVTITSYNEWQEGTQIEPARERGDRPGYDGAWGTWGRGARTSYLDATTRWIERFQAKPR